MKKSVKTEQTKRLVLLDTHAILHRAYHGIPDFSTSKGEPTGALYGLSNMLLGVIEDFKPDYIVACFDLKGPTYRHDLYKGYKAGRKETDDDLSVQIDRSYDIFKAFDIPVYEKEGFEADDMLGTITEQVSKQNSKQSRGDGMVEIVIASGDMDTLQLVHEKDVQVYTLKKGIKDTIVYDEDAVMSRFGFGPLLIPDYKGLRGDPSDNIIGVKGIGEKTATILITTFGTIEEMYKVLEAGHEDKFIKAGITPRIVQLLKDNKEEAEFSKMLATIRRNAPIDFVLPEKTFRDALDIAKVKALWSTLEFRTLPQRLEKVIQGKSVNKNGSETETNDSGEIKGDSKDGASNDSLFGANIPKEEIDKTALALWVVNSSMTNPKIEDIYSFAGMEDFAEAKKVIFTELDKRGLRKVYEDIELPLIPIIEKMEKRGIKIDRKILANLSKTYHVTLSDLEKKIYEMAGMEFNINSPKQLGEVLFDKLALTAKNMKKTEGGARSTRESELEKLRDLHPIIPFIFEYRELQKLLSTYIDVIPNLLDENNRLHTHFIQTGAATGRMASENPNVQNIPIKSELGRAIRAAFIADTNYVLASFDYSQVELRIAAFLSGDEKLISIFKNGEDVHTSVASFVFKVPLTEVTSEMRRRAKTINFGIIYGMGVNALKASLGTSREEAQNFLNDYFATFSTLATYLDQVKSDAAIKGYTETFFCRRRYFEGIKSKIPYIRAAAERMAINAPVQGTGADMVKFAMIAIDMYLTDKKLNDSAFLLLQVHDELIYEIKKSEATKLAVEIEKIMESIMNLTDTKGIPMKASSAVGNNWGELK